MNDLFIEYKGIEIYHIYKNDDPDQGVRKYGYSLSADGKDLDDDSTALDVRHLHRRLTMLPVPVGDALDWDNPGDHERILQLAIDHGLVRAP